MVWQEQITGGDSRPPAEILWSCQKDVVPELAVALPVICGSASKCQLRKTVFQTYFTILPFISVFFMNSTHMSLESEFMKELKLVYTCMYVLKDSIGLT